MIKWYGEDISEDELWDKITYVLELNEGLGYVDIVKWLVKGIKEVALSKEEKTFKVLYQPFAVESGGYFLEGDTQVKFVNAQDYVDAQDKILNSCTCRILDIEEKK